MRILHIIERVLAVLPHGKVEVELHLGIGRAGVEEKARRIDRDLVQQVGERQALAGALGHADDLAALHHAHELHEHDLQAAGAVQAERVQRVLQARHVAVVVRAPDIDDAVKAALLELVAVVGDIRGEIGVEAVRAAQHVVLVRAESGRAQPQRAVLLIGRALGGQQLAGLAHIAGVVQRGFAEPHVVMDLVALEVGLHLGDVVRQAEAHDHVEALLLVHAEQLVPVAVGQDLRQLADVRALVPALVELHRVLAPQELDIAPLDGVRELIHLVARVVDVKFAGHVVARPGEHLGQAVAQHAAARVAHMHGAGRVRGNELHHDLFRLVRAGAAKIRALLGHGAQRVAVPLGAQGEIDEAGTRDLRLFKVSTGKVHRAHERFRDLTRRLAQRLGALHGKGGRPVAVGGVLGRFRAHGRYLGAGQRARGDGGAVCLRDDGLRLLLGVFNQVHRFTLRYIVSVLLRFVFESPVRYCGWGVMTISKWCSPVTLLSTSIV